jgi:glycogen debranching enzyme
MPYSFNLQNQAAVTVEEKTVFEKLHQVVHENVSKIKRETKANVIHIKNYSQADLKAQLGDCKQQLEEKEKKVSPSLLK